LADEIKYYRLILFFLPKNDLCLISIHTVNFLHSRAHINERLLERLSKEGHGEKLFLEEQGIKGIASKFIFLVAAALNIFQHKNRKRESGSRLLVKGRPYKFNSKSPMQI
jgi:hypothetical protein